MAKRRKYTDKEIIGVAKHLIPAKSLPTAVVHPNEDNKEEFTVSYSVKFPFGDRQTLIRVNMVNQTATVIGAQG